MKKLLDWLDHRTGYRDVMHDALYERIPGGARWRYVWGSTLVFTFVVQMITGFFLWTAYSPSAQTAWESVYFINEVMYLGNLVRGMHHFAAQAMVVLMALHLMQVIIDGAYKAPREINFWLGLILMQIVLGLSLTGYLLPWDQKGYYATKVSTNIASATPVVGEEIQQLVQGGSEYGHHTLTRFFALHTGLLPALLIAFLALHLYVFRRHGITARDPDRAPTTTFWPDQLLRDSVACLAVLATVLLLAIYKGAELSAPANPAESYQAARPEWYFLFLFQFLRFPWVSEFGETTGMGEAFGAIYVPGFLMLILFLMPIIALWKWGHRFNRIFAWLMCGVIVLLTGMAFYEDANDEDHQAAVEEAHIEAERVMEIAKSEIVDDEIHGIPVEGAVTMLPNDPLVQGPEIFAKNCAACHHFDGKNGQGELVTKTVKDEEGNETKEEVKPVAADLGNFGSRQWMKSIITDYQNHFAPLQNSQWYQEIQERNKEIAALEKELEQLKEDEEESEKIEKLEEKIGQLEEANGDYIDMENGEMADWSNRLGQKLLKPENQDVLDALVEHFVAQAIEADQDDRQFESLEYDKELAEKGGQVLENADNGEGVLAYEGCYNCHPASRDGEGGGYPTLVNYGSQEWLKDFISNPGADRHYGSKNRMPVYEDTLSEHQIEMLVRWMTRDYAPTELDPEKLDAQEPGLGQTKETQAAKSETEESEKTD